MDRDTGFKFREERNVAVFTTYQALESLPILCMVHEAEDDWQFLYDTTHSMSDLKIIILEEVVEHSPSVSELLRLDYGWHAPREAVSKKWCAEEHEIEEKREGKTTG